MVGNGKRNVLRISEAIIIVLALFVFFLISKPFTVLDTAYISAKITGCDYEKSFCSAVPRKGLSRVSEKVWVLEPDTWNTIDEDNNFLRKLFYASWGLEELEKHEYWDRGRLRGWKDMYPSACEPKESYTGSKLAMIILKDIGVWRKEMESVCDYRIGCGGDNTCGVRNVRFEREEQNYPCPTYVYSYEFVPNKGGCYWADMWEEYICRKALSYKRSPIGSCGRYCIDICECQCETTLSRCLSYLKWTRREVKIKPEYHEFNVEKLKENPKTREMIEKYGEIKIFKPEWKEYRWIWSWWVRPDYDVDADLANRGWFKDFLNDKLCWVEVETVRGNLTIYGKTKLHEGKRLFCYLNVDYATLNGIKTDENTIGELTRRGEEKFPGIKIYFNFSATEFPELPVCYEGQERCDGLDVLKCIDGKWQKVGKVKGKCGVECINGSKCVGYDYYECKEYKWVLVESKASKCGFVCETGEEKCVGYDYYVCVKNEWKLIESKSKKCGYSFFVAIKEFLNKILEFIKGLFKWTKS